MDYVEFVEFVFRAYTEMDHGGAIIGTEEIAAALNLERRHDGVYNAVEDLQLLGVVGGAAAYIKATAFSEQVAEGAWALPMFWPRIFARPMTRDQETFLAKLVEIAHEPGDVSADVEMKGVLEVYSALGWTPSTRDPYRLSEALDEAGFIKSWPATGNDITLRPTYAGMVRVTRRLANEWQERLEELREEGETTTVDIKRELKINGEREKGEFVRDVLGLATTKASGRDRYLLIGFDDATGAFVQDVDPGISRDRLEQIINAYTDPKPEVDWKTVDMGTGHAGIVVVRRDAAKVPYRVAKRIWKLDVGNVYVRHGTQTEAPTPAELAALEAEGELARGPRG